MSTRLILLGPPGAGKGTLAAQLAERLSVPHLASGDILRAEIRQGTNLGLSVQHYLDSGDLVPDDIIVEVMINRLCAPDCADGYVLDGFPRTLPQAQALNAKLSQGHEPIDMVIYLDADTELIVSRLSGRLVCPQCGAIYHLRTLLPKASGKCDNDAAKLQTRPDDAPEVIRTRLQKYQELTQPLLEYYRREGRFRRLDGNKSVGQVFKAACSLLNKACASADRA